MTKKRRTISGADIFLAGGNQPRAKAGQQPSRQQDVKTAKLNDVKKDRVNYYVAPQVLDRLDQAQAELRRLSRKKISKSDIVGAALEKALKGFEEDQQKSSLYDDLTE